jgi:hypothetical protein
VFIEGDSEAILYIPPHPSAQLMLVSPIPQPAPKPELPPAPAVVQQVAVPPPAPQQKREQSNQLVCNLVQSAVLNKILPKGFKLELFERTKHTQQHTHNSVAVQEQPSES